MGEGRWIELCQLRRVGNHRAKDRSEPAKKAHLWGTTVRARAAAPRPSSWRLLAAAPVAAAGWEPLLLAAAWMHIALRGWALALKAAPGAARRLVAEMVACILSTVSESPRGASQMQKRRIKVTMARWIGRQARCGRHTNRSAAMAQHGEMGFSRPC